jgi:DNA gyrase subunit A
VEMVQMTNTHDNILFFTNRGRAFQLMAYDVPQGSRTAKGQALVNFLQLAPNEKVTTMLAMAAINDAKYLVMVTKKGLIKKSLLSDFSNVRRSGLIALKLKGDDSMEWVKPSTGHNEISIITLKGQAIRFEEGDVRPMGRTAAGVRGVRLHDSDEVIAMDIVDPTNKNLELLSIGDNGVGKRTPLAQYKVQGRGGSGIKTAEITQKTGNLIHARIVDGSKEDKYDLLMMSAKGVVIRMSLKTVSVSGRATQGVRLMRFKEENDRVASVTLIENIEDKLA